MLFLLPSFIFYPSSFFFQSFIFLLPSFFFHLPVFHLPSFFFLLLFCPSLVILSETKNLILLSFRTCAASGKQALGGVRRFGEANTESETQNPLLFYVIPGLTRDPVIDFA